MAAQGRKVVEVSQISDRCAGMVGARILEVQGERIRFYWEVMGR